QQVLADNPRNADALHLLGVVAYQVGRHEIAVNLITHAIEIDPQQVEAYNNLGIVFKEQKKLEKSIQTYHKAIEINPDHAEAHYNLGNAYQEQGKSEKSIQAYHKAIKIQPDYAEVYNNLGIVFKEQGKSEKSIQAYHKAIEIKPNYAEVYNNLGIVFKEQGKLEKSIQAYHKAIEIKPNYAEAYNNLGNAYQGQGKSEKSIQAYHKAIEIKPNYMQVYNNMGNAYQEQGELELAIQAYHKAIKIQPTHIEAYNNMGNAYQEQGELKPAIQAYHKAIKIQPSSAEAHNNLGNAYQEQGELKPAIQAYHKAIKIQPNFAEAHNNLGQILLLLGNFHQGWEEYEWRWQCRNSPAGERNFPQPLWNGSNLHGKSLLVWTEQGIGDEIMFANLLDSLKKIGTNIIVECEKRLVPFFQRSFPEIQFAPRENPPNSRLLNSDIDYQIPIGSLGQWLRTDEDSFKQNRQSYLTTCAEKSEQIQKRYQSLADDNILVGISWKSIGIKQRQTLSKSTALKDWTSILSQRDCHFINLQYGDTEPELEQFQAVTGLRIYHDQEIDPLQNLDDFAAQVSALDLVISTSNTTAHIAGALGKRVWTLLPYMPDWRWMLNRNDTLWYPCMRLFRQHTIGDWNDVFQRVGLALEQYVMNDKTDPKL
ncbi:TPA: tetratricopeptide repeat protein, partial [Candidatus Poribacteria bacterium]|nr:tetratricopeptide repeat protein [Candidatus Poribacteria bacterium]